MELVPGATLARRIAHGPLDYSDVVAIGLQVGSALRESDQFDIVHGDIKPSNILLHDDLAKLSDFGLSHRVSDDSPRGGKVAGTPNYMAPEICRGVSFGVRTKTRPPSNSTRNMFPAASKSIPNQSPPETSAA